MSITPKATNQRSNFGFHKVAAIVPKVYLADPQKNAEEILSLLNDEKYRNAEFIVFPELSLTGYTVGDLFFQDILLKEAIEGLLYICSMTKEDDRLIFLGLPVKHKGRLYNCAAAISNGRILGLVPKTHIPNYQEFYEKRWFESGKTLIDSEFYINGEKIPIGINLLFKHNDIICGVEICEDLWVPSSPSSKMALAGATLIMNLSATDETYGKHEYLTSIIASQSGRCRCAYVYSSAGRGESSSDLIFSGNAIIAYDGTIIDKSERFVFSETGVESILDFEKLENDRKKYSSFYDESSFNHYNIIDSGIKFQDNNAAELYKKQIKIDRSPFVPKSEKELYNKCNEIINIQSWGLAQRLTASGCNKIIVGISGGLDSTLALLIAVHTFKMLKLPLENIIAITMPGPATSTRTRSNATDMMKLLGVKCLEIPIGKSVDQHFKDINHEPSVKNAVYENSQARERTQILMDMANKERGMVLGTGDLSELALGWCTYNGDHMSMYNVNGGVPKTLVKYLVGWFSKVYNGNVLSKVLIDIIDTPISPELIPSEEGEQISQKTEDLVGPYELHDFFLYHFLRNGFTPDKILWMAEIAFENIYDKLTIKKWLDVFYNRFFSQQFKRSCMPDGPKVGTVSLSPRGDWRMPSDARPDIWKNFF